MAKEGLILTESQVKALERKGHDDEACGEIDTQPPGYLASQGTFYVGTFKDFGVFTNKPMSIPMQRWPIASCIPPVVVY